MPDGYSADQRQRYKFAVPRLKRWSSKFRQVLRRNWSYHPWQPLTVLGGCGLFRMAIGKADPECQQYRPEFDQKESSVRLPVHSIGQNHSSRQTQAEKRSPSENDTA